MKTALFAFLFLLIQASSALANNTLQLSQTDRDTIVKAMGLIKGDDFYYIEDCKEKNPTEMKLEDLNKDGQPEVFVVTYGACLGGAAGSAVTVFIKHSSGVWQPNLGFPGIYRILKTQSQGFADIELRGVGKCSPVWRWNGTTYGLYKNCPAKLPKAK